MNLDKVAEILKKGYVCDRCVGRQFAQLLTETDNEKRGQAIRFVLAMQYDSGMEAKINEANFYGFHFHSRKVKSKKPGKCSVCGDIFGELKKKVEEIRKAVKGYEFGTILIGTKPPDILLKKEQAVWDEIGFESCEPIRSELNRVLGRMVCEDLGKDVDKKAPDMSVVYDFKANEAVINPKPLLVYGKYRKLVRGMPQSEWKTKIYKTSVQGVIERPLLKATKGDKTSFHGAGREDVDARCLGWRPFIIEVKNPRKRIVKFREMLRAVKKSRKVEVKGLRFATKIDVRDIKSAKYDKKYRLVVRFEGKLEGLERIKELKGATIIQRTPNRVLRRRANKARKRQVKDIRYKVLGRNKLEIAVRAESGLYVKELVSGDGGRTEPNVAGLINNKVKNIELDVIKVYCD
ncbi:hypothetical protein A3K63_00055 [Candidatus Micrarchaeota archaeon RBG_16_49_10]|nr:MAG: hypothetical protein A3K63_00055 [Candidatus Micrarchaeota archaeon RBG_16_49_10]